MQNYDLSQSAMILLSGVLISVATSLIMSFVTEQVNKLTKSIDKAGQHIAAALRNEPDPFKDEDKKSSSWSRNLTPSKKVHLWLSRVARPLRLRLAVGRAFFLSPTTLHIYK